MVEKVVGDFLANTNQSDHVITFDTFTKTKVATLEWFKLSAKVIPLPDLLWLCIATLCNWLKNLAPLS